MSTFTESVVEDAVLAWLESLGHAVLHGPDIAVGMPGQALVRLNPDLPAEALEDAFRKLMRTDAPSLLERNRALHRLRVDVTIEHCDAEDRVR